MTYHEEDWTPTTWVHPEERQEKIEGLLDKATERYQDAVHGFKNDAFSLTANKLYHALRHACVALAITKDHDPGNFHGLRTLIFLKFVSEGTLKIIDYKLIIDVYDLWQISDYDPFYTVSRQEVEPYISRVKDLLRRISLLLNI